MCSSGGGAFDCLATTLEIPFKDNANAPDAVEVEPRAQPSVGTECAQAIEAVLDRL